MNWCGGWKPVTAMLAINFAFAILNILLKKIIDERTGQLVIVTYRQLTSTVFLVPIAYFWERKSKSKLTARILYYLFVSALVGATLTQYFFLLGLQYTSATFACAFINMVPVNTFLMALPFGLEKLDIRNKGGRAKVLGTLVCIGGAMLMTFYKGMPLNNIHSKFETPQVTNNAHTGNSSPKMTDQNWIIGSILLTAAILLWSSWFLIQSKIGKIYPNIYSNTAILSFFSTIQSAILCFTLERDMSKWVLKGTIEISSIVYAGAVGSGLCYVGMSWCVEQRGPVFTAAFSPLVQIFVALFEFSILHEQIHLGSLLGSILVILGLYILLWGKSQKETGDCSTQQAS